MEELVDVIEVVYRIAELKGVSREKLETLREEKARQRGKFKENLFLVDVTEKDLILSYKQIRKELKKYSNDLLKKKEIIVLNKVDLIEKSELKEKIKLFEAKIKKKIKILSNTDKKLISKLKLNLLSYVFK